MGLGPSREDARWEHCRRRSLNEENDVDPDDGRSWLCSACTLPIFSTPFKSLQSNTDSGDGGKLCLHDGCANLPEELIDDHVLHPGQPLILKQTSTSKFCHKCEAKCGSMFYQCPDINCSFRLDLLCALQIKILHRSHEHRLMVIRGSASFICGACGTQHQGPSPLSYLCNPCGFWIHPDCASLPNAIILHAKHHHSLFLTYYLPRGSDSATHTCAICGGVIESLGVYFCVKCRYCAHIKCVMSDPQSFKPVMIRDAKLADLLHFPLADEHTSVMRYIIEITSGVDGTTSSSGEVDTRDEHHQSGGKLFQENLHQHPLIFHDQDDIDDDDDHPGVSRVCNACVQFISPPFYSCSQCPYFFLHSCCAKLPSKIKHPVHQQHTLFLFPKAPKSDISACFRCKGCRRSCNGFAYFCKDCDFTMGVVCAMMPPLITHESHGKTHILYMSHKLKFGKKKRCNCCDDFLLGISYECHSCRHFKLHAKCALFPNTIRHKFDEHPLKLTTEPKNSVAIEVDHTVYRQQVQQYCEICEEAIQKVPWYYSCNHCEQLFHIACIPSVDSLSRVKLCVTLHVNCHDCPLTLIRCSTVKGYQCGYCRETIRRHDRLAYECSKCYFRIHDYCANQCLLKS